MRKLLTLLPTDSVKTLGITSNETYLTGNVGGGVKWFATPHMGVRGDLRLFMVGSKDTRTFLSEDENRYGVRLYGGFLFTY